MFRSLFVAVVSSALIASAAAAAPTSLMKGHWSIGYEAGESGAVQIGIGAADMTRIIVDVWVKNTKPGGEGSSVTGWSVGGAFHRYMSGMATDHFAPFFGAGVDVSKTGVEDSKASFAVNGRFGGEAFVIEPLSIGGFIGVEYEKEGDTKGVVQGQPVTIKGPKYFSTVRSAITATLYWGGTK